MLETVKATDQTRDIRVSEWAHLLNLEINIALTLAKRAVQDDRVAIGLTSAKRWNQAPRPRPVLRGRPMRTSQWPGNQQPKGVFDDDGLVQTLKPWSSLQRRVPLLPACLPMTFAVAAGSQSAAAPAQTAVERIEGGYTDVGTALIRAEGESQANTER